MERRIRINSFDIKHGEKAGDYHLFDTDQGKMSCFDQVIGKKLVETIDVGSVLVDVTVKGQYTTITKIIDKPKESTATPIPAKTNSQTAMYVSYAKDIFIAMLNDEDSSMGKGFKEIMNDAVDSIKQAKEAFE